MPFPKWSVEPVFLCRKPLPPDKKELCNFYPATHKSLVNCLRQLSSVAKIADHIFEEIGCECRLLAERTERIKDKINSIEVIVSNLNARAVHVPVSDLCTTARFLRREKAFLTHYEQTTQLFLPSTRPPCVDSLYNAACTTPVAVMCTIDRYRTDGLSCSELFMVTPVLGGVSKKRRRLLDIETRKPANFSLVEPKQDRIKSGSASMPSMIPSQRGYILKQNENLELERLPSPEEQAMLVSLEYPSAIVPVDTSGRSFKRMSLFRRSLIHVDFIIKRKSKKKSKKRRHTICEVDNQGIEQAIRHVANTSCQTEVDLLDVSSSSSFHRSFSLTRRRSRSVQDNSRRKNISTDDLDLDSLKMGSKDSATEDDKEKSSLMANTATMKKSKTSSLRSRAFNPISSLSAAISIAAVKMRNSTRKHDDGRSSSGNWSASSSTRASVDSSDHQQAISPIDGVSSPSRNSVGKDSVLSDATTNQDQHNRSRDDDILPIQSLTSSPIKKKKYASIGLPWESNNRTSKTPTPDFTSSSTPLVRSPYAGRRGVSDDGDSSVYSVDTDGYYTSMHTDSVLWCNPLSNLKTEDVLKDLEGFRERKQSQSSVSTNDNSSINSFLSKSATECSSSNSDSLKDQPCACPLPPPRLSSYKDDAKLKAEQELDDSDKSYSPHPPNGSCSESEHDSNFRDRIRVKTSITPNRYPSMCAVSPETSDEELSDLKRRTIVPNVNIVVAEIHQECVKQEAISKNKSEPHTAPINNKSDKQALVSNHKTDNFQDSCELPNTSGSINMYRSETPVPSNFSSSILNSHPVGASTPRSGINITTFSTDFNETINPNTKRCTPETKNGHDLHNNLMVSEKPLSPHPISSTKSLIPLKYAQRITVTPIARTDCTGTIKRTPLRQSTQTDTPPSSPSMKKETAPSYISFKAPDSPVSTISSFNISSSNNPSSPTGSLTRPIARVTLDPLGKVVYSSNSLDRSNSVSPNKHKIGQRPYSTLPTYQINNTSNLSTDPIISRSTTPISNRCTTPTISRSTTTVNNRSSTPIVLSRSTTPVNNRSTTPSNIKQTTAVPDSTPVNSRSTTPVNNRSSTPINRFTPINSTQILVNSNSTFANNRSTTANNCRISPINSPPLNTNSTSSICRSTTPSSVSLTPTACSTAVVGQTTTIVNGCTDFVRGEQNRLRNSAKINHRDRNCDATSNRNFEQSSSMLHQTPQNHFTSFNSANTSNEFTFRPSRGGRFCRSYFPSHLISPPSTQTQNAHRINLQNSYQPPSPDVNVDRHQEQLNPSNYSAGQNYQRTTSRVSASSNSVPNIKTQDTKPLCTSNSTDLRPNRYHSSSYSKQNRNVFNALSASSPKTNYSLASLSPPDLIPSGESPPSTLDITSSASTHRRNLMNNSTTDSLKDPLESLNNNNNLKSLSANELFAIIHSSKKKHNIKTESEKSMSPMSSRSVSPALSQSSLSKIQPVETGVLTRRYENSPDKSKWCNSLPSSRKPAEKLATKPTSMHDFKMLLLQTRTGSHDSNPRPSAAELLKVSPPKSSPSPKSPSNYKSTPVSNFSYSPGHGTVPIKRNMRTRSPYLSRYDSAYPPIIEDCSEEMESYEENKCLPNLSYNNSPQTSQPLTKATSTWV